ncbi:MAG TPA: hypothetical protein VIM07_07035 [Chitinophagaceae bacterium]
MNTKTVVTAAILATMGVENSLKHKEDDLHTHIEAEPAIQNQIIGITYISGRIKITEFADHTYSYSVEDR